MTRSQADTHCLSRKRTRPLLEERLNRVSSDESVEVFNMYRGHSPSIYSFHIRSDVPRYTPDAVLLQIELLNDVSDEAHVRTVGRDGDGLPLEIPESSLQSSDGTATYSLPSASRVPFRNARKPTQSSLAGMGDGEIVCTQIRSSSPVHPDFFYSSSADRYFLTRTELDAGFERLFEAVSGIHQYLARREIRFLLVILALPRVLYGRAPRRICKTASRPRANAPPSTSKSPTSSPSMPSATRGAQRSSWTFVIRPLTATE